MPDHLPWLDSALEDLAQRQLVRKRRRVVPRTDGWCEVDGRRLVNFAANDYLNLAHDPRVRRAAADALETTGAGAGASALVTGRTDWHDRLEAKLAAFEGQPAAVLFPTGYAANVGAIGALVGHGDVIFSDALNHASLIDGCRLSRAEVRVYPHRDVAALEGEFAREPRGRRRLIVTDSIFSMDGDAAPLAEICDLAERHGADVLIDEAHATGVFGARGRGLAEQLGVEERVAVRVGTLSKAVGTLGGFVAGEQRLIDWLWNSARTQIFSTALPPAVCAAACASLDIIAVEPERRVRLAKLGARLRNALAALGFESAAQSVGPIVPVILGDPERTLRVAAQLEEAGMIVGAIRPPSVPVGTSRLRISLSCAHRDEDVDRLIETLQTAL